MTESTDRVALITGGFRGQGRAMALTLASAGWDIVICDIVQLTDHVSETVASDRDMHSTIQAITAVGRHCHAQVADVRDQCALDKVVASAIDAFGKIDVLIANAGIAGKFKPFWELSEDEWQDSFDVNITGVWHSAKAVAPHMISRQHGSMVFTGSLNSLEGGINIAHYVATKHAVAGFMKCAALELGLYGIRVNAVLPGAVDTPMLDNPADRDSTVGHSGATREELEDHFRHYFALRGRSLLPATAIADAVAWLVSDAAEHVTGLELVIDGGHNILPGYNPAPVAS